MATRQGYLVIADISGYTAFLTGTELEHAQGIIEDLYAVIHRALVPALRLVKLEGDALFCCGEAERFTDGERLIEMIESCHYDFKLRLDEMQRNTTCRCAACASIGGLDLKFVAHYGEFVPQRLAGAEDIAGPDVILTHRLLKSSVSERTGWRGYVLVTEACRERTGLRDDWQPHVEQLPDIGSVRCAVRDLNASTGARRASHRILVDRAEADFALTRVMPAVRAVVWQYWLDADKRARWQTHMRSMSYDRNERGRMGAGAVGHCDHGSWASDMRFVDWRPFQYYTLERVTTRGSVFSSLPPLTETLELHPLDGGQTQLDYRIKAHTAGGRLKMKLMGILVRRFFEKDIRLLERVLREDGVADAGTPGSGL